jgi:hypothetical protein
VATVPLTFADWTGDEELPPGDNADAGLLPDFDEFAFMGDPNNPNDDATVRPILRRAGGLLSVEFNLRKGAHLDYILHGANQLTPPAWTELWRASTDGTGASNVAELTDLGTHYRLRIQDGGASAGPRFLLLEVREPAAP